MQYLSQAIAFSTAVSIFVGAAHLHFKQLNPAIVFDAQACALIGVCAQFTSISAANSLAQERLTPRHQFASSQFQLSNLFCNTFAGKVCAAWSLWRQHSKHPTAIHTHIYTRPWPRPISSTMQAKVFKNFSSLRVQQIQFVRLGAFALSLSMWLIHLQFQSKQTNNLTTYITYSYICMHVLVYSTNTIYIGTYFTQIVILQLRMRRKTFAVAIVEAPGTKVPSASVAKVPKEAVFRLDIYIYSCIFLVLVQGTIKIYQLYYYITLLLLYSLYYVPPFIS